MAAGYNILSVQLQIVDLFSQKRAPTVVDTLTMTRCTASTMFTVDIPAADAGSSQLGYAVIAYNSTITFIADWANCTSGSYYTGIDLSSPANAISTLNTCGGTVESDFNFVLNGQSVSCSPTTCNGYNDKTAFIKWPNATVSAVAVNGTCFPGYGGSPAQLCTATGWTASRGQCVQCPVSCNVCTLSGQAQLACSECAAGFQVSGNGCTAPPASNSTSIYYLLAVLAVVALLADGGFFWYYRRYRHKSSRMRSSYLWTGCARVPLLFAGVFDTISDVFFIVVVSETTNAQAYLGAAIFFTIVPYAINLTVALVVGVQRAFASKGTLEQASWFGAVVFTFLSGDVVPSLTLAQALRTLHSGDQDARGDAAAKDQQVDGKSSDGQATGRLHGYNNAFGSHALTAAIALFVCQFLFKDIPHLAIQAAFLSYEALINPIVILALAATMLTTAVGLFSFVFFTLIPLMQTKGDRASTSSATLMKMRIVTED